ncbi:Sulfite reductase, dissimilatory-type subunit gamma [subsurface metagenome]
MAITNQFLASTLDLDEEGFLRQPEMWNRDVAQLLAQEEVPNGLTEDHWKIVGYLRQYYLEFGTVPPVRMLRRDTGFNLECIYKLFPSGLTRGACRIAGIPRNTIRPNFLYP